MKPLKILLYISVCSVVIMGILGLIFICHTAVQFKKASTPVYDIAKYESILKEWKGFAPDIVNHFPEVIPPDAQNTEFYFRPGFLQSDSRIELQYRTMPENIENLYDEFSKLKTESSHGGMLIHFPIDGGEADIIELGEDWEIMHFEADSQNLPEHSKEYGVMISREKNEIIYWAEW